MYIECDITRGLPIYEKTVWWMFCPVFYRNTLRRGQFRLEVSLKEWKLINECMNEWMAQKCFTFTIMLHLLKGRTKGLHDLNSSDCFIQCKLLYWASIMCQALHWNLPAGDMAVTYIRSQQTFSRKGRSVNIFGFACHTDSAAVTQLCLCSPKAATDHVYSKGHGGVPIKLYSQRQLALGP